jgi:hypothetical protein
MLAKVSLKDRISNFNIEKYGSFLALSVLLLIMLVLQLKSSTARPPS